MVATPLNAPFALAAHLPPNLTTLRLQYLPDTLSPDKIPPDEWQVYQPATLRLFLSATDLRPWAHYYIWLDSLHSMRTACHEAPDASNVHMQLAPAAHPLITSIIVCLQYAVQNWTRCRMGCIHRRGFTVPTFAACATAEPLPPARPQDPIQGCSDKQCSSCSCACSATVRGPATAPRLLLTCGIMPRT